MLFHEIKKLTDKTNFTEHIDYCTADGLIDSCVIKPCDKPP